MPEATFHEHAVELLPWLVNGSLEPEEAKALRAHAAACVACRRELEQLERLQVAVASDCAGIPVPPADMQRINRRIDRDLERRGMLRRRLAQAALWFTADPWRTAAVLQAAALVLLIAFYPQRGDDARYELLTDTPTFAGDHVRIVFDPALGGDEILERLDALPSDVVAGGSRGNIYTVRCDAQTCDALAESLRSEPGVVFAEPVRPLEEE